MLTRNIIRIRTFRIDKKYKFYYICRYRAEVSFINEIGHTSTSESRLEMKPLKKVMDYAIFLFMFF